MNNQILSQNQKTSKTIWINVNPNISAQGYVIIGNLFSVLKQNNTLGSGIIACKEGVRYPIYNPLTLHNENHLNILTYANSYVLKLVDEYLESIPDPSKCEELLNQVHKLLNLSLAMDQFESIAKEVLIEALTNFCLDYTTMSNGTLLRQPLNYIFDILNIDGIHSEDLSVSYMPADCEGIEYS